jgi:hypothetical protein
VADAAKGNRLSLAVARRGRLTLPEDRRDYLRALLLNEYQGHEEFFVEWVSILCYFERLLEALPRVLHPPVGVEIDQPEQEWQALQTLLTSTRPHRFVGRYKEEITELSSRWGLRCDWSAAWIHWSSLEWANRGMSVEDLERSFAELPPEAQRRAALARDAILESVAERAGPLATRRRLPWLNSSLRKFFKREAEAPGGLSLVPWYFLDNDLISQSEASHRFDYLLERGPTAQTEAKLAIEVEVDLLRDGGWSTVKRRVVEAARRQWEEQRHKTLEAGYILQDTQPQLATHVRWLFLRICPQPHMGRPLGWRAIAKSECVSVETVRNAVIPPANELGLTSPRLPAGRLRPSPGAS